jgi:hypothetical protein
LSVVLYLYAVKTSGGVPRVPGLFGASLRAVGKGGPFAIVSEHEQLRLEPSEGALWAHEDVVEELMSDEPLLPMRFGSALPNEAAVLEMLNARHEELEHALDVVRGAVELSVRIAIDSEPDTGVADEQDWPGTAYLMERLRRERHQSEVTARVHERLASLSRESTRWSGEPRRRLWKAAYLVDHERVEDFIEQVNRLETQLSDAAVVCTGPWPPYSFSSEGRAP